MSLAEILLLYLNLLATAGVIIKLYQLKKEKKL